MFNEQTFQPLPIAEITPPIEIKDTPEATTPSPETKEDAVIASLHDIELAGQELLHAKQGATSTLSPEAQIILKQSLSIDTLSRSVFQAIDNFQDHIPPFFLSEEMEALLHHSAGEDPNSSQLSQEYMATRKRFMQNLIHHIQEKSHDPKQKESLDRFIIKAEELFINSSPNFLDYIGTYKDSLEIASELRTVPELAGTYQYLISGLVYDLEYHQNTEQLKQFFEQWIDTAPPEQQFHIIRTLTEIGKAAAQEGYTENIFSPIIKTLNRDIPQSALTSIIAKASAEEISQHTYHPENGPKQLRHKQHQTALSMYIHPSTPTQGITDHIAKNTVGFRDTYGQIKNITTIPEENIQSIESLAVQPTLSEIQTIRRVGLDQAGDILYPQNTHRHIHVPEEALQNFQSQLSDIAPQHLSLLQELHQPKVRDIIESHFDIQLTDISLQSQVWLLKYLAESNTHQLERFTQTIQHQASPHEKALLLESFLSIGQGGQEMGEKILTIAEKLPPEIASRIFSKYEELSSITHTILSQQTTSEQQQETSDDADRKLAQYLL